MMMPDQRLRGVGRWKSVEVEHIWNVWKNLYGTYGEDGYGTYGNTHMGFKPESTERDKEN